MTAKEKFEKWWSEHGITTSVPALGNAFKEVAEKAYLSGHKAAVQHCVELARAYEGCDEKILEDIDL